MKLSIFLNVPIYRYNKNYSGNYVNLLDFFLTLASSTVSMNIVLPVGYGKGKVNIEFPHNVSILELPYYSGPFHLLKIGWKFIPKLFQVILSKTIRKTDVVGIVAPGTIFFLSFPLIHFIYKKPIFLIVRGYKKKTIKYAYQKNFFKKIIALIVMNIYDFLVKIALKRENTILFTIGFNEELIKQYGNKDKIFNIMPMIPEFLIKERTNNFIKQKTQINILYVGRLSNEKGINDLLQAMYEIIKNYNKSKIYLHIVGSGPEEYFLKQKVKELGLDKIVNFHGFIPRGDKLWKIVDSSDIFVLPSYTEGLPRAVFEAMARGVPVVCTKVGGIPEIIKDGINGLLVKPADITGLKNAIIKLIENSKLRIRLIENGYKTVRCLTFERQGKKMIELIQRNLIIQNN